MKTPTWFGSVLVILLLSLSSLSWAEPVNINTATQAEFTTLRGIGEKKARAIVLYRTEKGSFNSIDELLNVKGIGPATLLKNEQRLSIGAISTAPASAGLTE